jgi:hypothetical protein
MFFRKFWKKTWGTKAKCFFLTPHVIKCYHLTTPSPSHDNVIFGRNLYGVVENPRVQKISRFGDIFEIRIQFLGG